MGTFNVYQTIKKEKEEEKKSNKHSGVLEQLRVENANRTALEIYERLPQLITKSNTLLKEYNNRFFDKDGNYINKFRGDTALALDKYSSLKNEYDTEVSSILDRLNKHRNYLNDDFVKDIEETLNGNSKNLADILNAYTTDNDYFSKFKNEEEYNSHIQSQKEYEAWTSADINALKTELDGLESKYNSYISLKTERDNLYSTIVSGYMRAGYSRKNAEAEALKAGQIVKYDKELSQYGDMSGMDSTLSEKKQFLNNATHIQEGIALRDNALNAEDFEEYSLKGKNLDSDTGVFIFNNYLGKNEIEYWRKKRQKNIEAAKKLDPDFDENKMELGNDRETLAANMNDEEVSIYNYYLAKFGEDKAEEFLKSIQESVLIRGYEKAMETIEGKWGLELTFAAAAGLENWILGVKSLFNNEGEYAPQTSMQILSGMAREDISDKYGVFGQGAYDLVNTTANMLPSILVSTMTGNIAGGLGAGVKAAQTIGKIAGAATLGASAAGNGYQEMLNLGYDKNQAQAYGTLVGLSEAGLEYVLGGISSLGGTVSGGITDKIVTKLISNVDNAIAKVAIGAGGKLVGSMVSEFGEEYLQEVLDPVFKNITLNTNEDIKLFSTEALYSGILGALSAGLLEGGSTISGEVATYKAGKDVKNTGQLSNLKNFGTSFSADTVAYKIASQVNKNTDAYTIGQLLHEVGADSLSEVNMADIAKSLERKGIESGQAQTIAKWLNSAVMGENFSPLQRLALKNPDITQTFKDVIINQNSTVNQRMQGYQNILQSIANEKASQAKAKANAKAEKKANKKAETAEETKSTPFIPYSSEEIAKRQATGEVVVDSEGKQITDNKNAVEGKFEVNLDGKTVNVKSGEEVNVSEIASIDNGQMKLKLDNGETVDAEDISFGTEDDNLIYSTVLDMGVNAAVANSLVKNYNPSDKLSAKQYALGIKEAYRYGSYGMPINEISKKGFAADLSEAQRTHAYNLGKADSAAKVAKAQIEAEKGISGKGGIEGKVNFNGDKLALTEVQRESLKRMGVLSEVLGVDFHVFESYMQGNNRVFKDTNGKIKKAPNGYYKDGKIYIDLNAGLKGQGTMIYTVAHELTHWIREWSPAKFKILADFLMEQYGEKGRNVNDLVQAQIDKAKSNGRTIDFDEAYEEVVADSMELMLKDDNVFEKILELKSKDASIVKKIGEFFAKIMDSFKKLMQQYPPETPEGKLVAEMKDSFAKLQELFAEALVDASDNYQANKEQKNTTSEGGVKFMARNNTNIDKYGYNADNNSRANKQGELINDYYYALTKSEWNTFYKEIAEQYYLATAIVGTVAPIVVNDKLVVSERLYTGKDAHDYVVIDAFQFQGLYDWDLLDSIKKLFDIGDLTYDRQTMYQNLSRILKRNQSAGVLTRFDADSKQYVRGDTSRINGKYNEGIHGDSQEGIVGERVSLRDKSSIQEGNELLKKSAETLLMKNSSANVQDVGRSDSKDSIPQTFKKSQEKQSGRDSEGNTLTEEQIEYFKDSKVRDAEDNLLVCYHGTDADFNTFDYNFISQDNKLGFGFYFMAGKKLQYSYKNPLKTYLNITNPITDTSKNLSKEAVTEFCNKLGINFDYDSADSDLDVYVRLSYSYTGKTKDFLNAAIDILGVDGVISEERKTAVAFSPEQAKLTTNANPTTNPDIRYSDREIIGESGTNYGKGVYLDSNLLTGLTESERKQMVKEFVINELAGQHFIAYDNNNDAVDIGIAKKSDKVKKNKVLNELHHKNNDIVVKQEAIVLIDELIANAKYDTSKTSNYSHDWLDNYGKNNWDYWKVFIQEKNKTVWEATLNIANTSNGEKILYDIKPIKKVEEGIKSPSASTNDIIFQDNGKSQVKFSDRDSQTADDIEKINKQLAKENVKLIEDVKYLKELVKLQGKETHGKILKKSSIELVAKRLMTYSNAKGDTSELAGYLNGVYSYIAQGEDVSWEGIQEKSQAAVDWLMQHENYKPVRDELATEILSYLRNSRVSLDSEQKSEAAYYYGSYNAFRKKNMGRVIFTDSGISLDSLWQDLAERYPSYFDAEINSADQPIKLTSIINKLQNTFEGDEYFYYPKEMIAQDLMEKVYEGYWDVATLHTVADAKQKEINLLKSKHRQRMEEVKESHAESEAKLRQEHRDKIAQLRTQYREREEAKIQKVAQYYQKSRKEAVDRAKETREKREAITKLQRLVLDTAKWVSYPAKDAVKCPDIIRSPYAKFLNSIDLSSKRLNNGGEPTQNDLRVASAMDSLAKVIEQKLGTQSPDTDTETILDTGYLDLPVHFIENLKELAEDLKERMEVDGHIVNAMTSEEIKSLTQFIKTLNHSIKEMSTLYSNMRFARVEQLGNDSMLFLKDLGEAKQSNSIASFVTWNNALPYYTFKRFGVAGESVFEELMDAQDKLAYLADEIFKFKDKTWTDKEASEWSKDTHTIKLPSGRELTLTSSDAMSIYCLSRREQGRQHLLGGGVRVLGIEKNGKKANDSRSLLNQQDILAIASSLTERQRQVAEDIQEYMSTVCSEWGNEISMKRFLTKEFTEKFYFPIESNDENLDTKDPKAQQSDLYRLLNISATKPLTKGANNEVIIRNVFDVFTNHSSDMARLNAYGMALLDYMKWINYREKTVNDDGQISVSGVRKSMEKAYGPEAKKYVIGLIKDINGRFNDNGDNQFLMKMTRMAKTAMVGANLRVSLLQFTAYPRAAMVLSNKSLALGLSKVPQIKKAKKYCGIALWKSFGFYDTNISRSIEDQIKGTINIRQKLIELSLKGAEWGDAITWGCLWNACEYEVAKTKQYKVGSEEFNQAVGKKLREVVYATQVVDSTLTRSQMMRSKSGLTQMASAFMSEPTLSANILMDAGFQFNLEKRRTGSAKLAWQKTGKYIGKAVAVYSIVQIIAALAEALSDAYRDDDDEEYIEKFGEAFKENAISDLNPFNKIPIIADVSDAALALLGIGYYSSNSLASTAINEANNAFDIWSKVINGEGGKTVYSGIYSTTKLISYITGVSASGAMREVVTLWNNTAGAADPYLKIRTYESSATDKGIAEYKFDKGDTASVKTTVSKMIKDKVKSGKTEKEAKSAVKSSFTSTYKAEYMAAVNAKDYDEMNRIRKFLYATGLYGTLSELDETLKKWRTDK